MIEYTEDTEANRFVIRVRRADGSMFLTAVKTAHVDEQEQLVLVRKFFVGPKPSTPNIRRPHHDALRVLARGAWVEWEDVTDRIRPVEAKEIEDGRRDQGSHEVTGELADPVPGVKE